jgi:hypothetical protein
VPDGLRKRLETAVLTPTRPDPDPDRTPEEPVIKTTACIVAACDVCGAQPPGLNDGDTHFEPGREDDALNEAENADWWTDETTRLVLCDKRDDAHTAKAREIAAGLGPDVLITFLTYWPELDEQGRSEQELRAAWRETPPSIGAETSGAA